MADPTVTPDNLADALRVKAGDTPLTAAQTSILARVHASAVALVTAAAPEAPVAVANEAVIRLAGWLYDTDPAQSTRAATDPMQRSGAAALLARWRPQSLRGASLTGIGVAPGEDATARAAAAAAQATATSAVEDADQAAAAAAAAQATAASAVEDADQAAMTATQALARVPAALPAPAAATRGHALAQAADSETMVFRSGGEADDGVARAAAAANATKLAELGPDLLTFNDKSILANLAEDLDHSLADSTRVQVVAQVGKWAANADLSGLAWAASATVDSPAGAVFFAIRVPTAIVRDAGVTGGRLSVTPVAFEPFPWRDFIHHAGDATYEYFTSLGGVSPVDNETVTAHYEESDLNLAIGSKHLATEVKNRLLTAGETGILETLAADVAVVPARSARVDLAWVPPGFNPSFFRVQPWANPAQMTAGQGNAHGPFHPAARVPIADIADPAITAGRISIPAFGPANDLLHAIFSNYYSERFRNSTHVFYTPDGLDVEPLGSGVRSTAEFIENPTRLQLALNHLAAAVVARLLPANPSVGQLLGVALNGSPAWTTASGGVRTAAGGVVNLSAANTWAEVQGVGTLGANQLLLLFLGGRANLAFIGSTGIEAVYGRWVTQTATIGGREGAANLRFAKLANGNLLWGKQHGSSGLVRTTFLVIG